MRKPAAVKTTSAVPAKQAATAAAQPEAKSVSKALAAPAATPAATPAVKAAATPALKTPAAKVVKPATARAKPALKAAPANAPKAAKPPKAARPAAAKLPAPAATQAAEPVREKARKTRLVRDSFTMPEHEYELLGQVKKACLKAGFDIKKSELLRIGVALVGQLDLATLQNVLASLPQLKTGRPKNI